jgi:hypothetical protein
VAARSKARVCGHSLSGIAGSNLASGMDVRLLLMLCVVRCRSLRQADRSSRGVLLSMVSECDREVPIIRRPWPSGGLLRYGGQIKDMATEPKMLIS